MAIKPSKYILRKQKTGSLNSSSDEDKKKKNSSFLGTNIPQYINSNNNYIQEEEQEEYLPFSEENFLEHLKYKSFIYYSTIKDTFWYLTIRKNPVLLFSNNLMQEKYKRKDIMETDKAYTSTYLSLSFAGDYNNHKEIENVFDTPIIINDFKTLPIRTEKKHLMSFYARATQDDSQQWFGITTLSALYLINKDLNQIKNLLSHFELNDIKEILEFTIENASKKSNSDYLKNSNLKENLIDPLINTAEMFESLLEYYIMKDNTKNEQDKNNTNEVKPIKLKKF